MLQTNVDIQSRKHKVLIVVMDGVGWIDTEQTHSVLLNKHKDLLPASPFLAGNAVNAAYMPHLGELSLSPLFRTLRAHGSSVGLPSDDDVGNSEVGHNALGSGRVFDQGAKLVNEAIESGKLFSAPTWKQIVERDGVLAGKNTVHFCGLLSDGNVHSHIDHLFALIAGAKKSGAKKVRLHLLLDGRDVSPDSAEKYLTQCEEFIKSVKSSDFDVCIASGGGRMNVTMDRYESDWSIVERGYNCHVLGEGSPFRSALEALKSFRKEGLSNDQFLPAFVVVDEKQKPKGLVEDGDSVIFFNFRGDRAIQITRALTEEKFSAFPRKRWPHVFYAGMMQYDGDLQLPKNFLVTPPEISNTMTELLSASKVKQFACSETHKYGHVTYFWNGNRSSKFDEQYEDYVEVPSLPGDISLEPWMKAKEITDVTIAKMKSDSFRIGRINYANGDMVGHTGDFAATTIALATVDHQLGRLKKAALESNTILLITADHGNSDEMYERDKKSGKIVFTAENSPKPRTSHSLSPVPFAVFNEQACGISVKLKELPEAGLANIAATAMYLAGFEPPRDYKPSLLEKGVPSPNKVTDKKTELTSKDFSPKASQKRFSFAQSASRFHEVVTQLREPVTGCPWDLEQTFKSLQSYMVEEAYEAVQASEACVAHKSKENLAAFCDELGDVLLQVFLNAQISSQEDGFSVTDVFNAISEKMIRRHPHVFGPQENKMNDAQAVLVQWDKIKESEKGQSQSNNPSSVILKKALKKSALPTLMYGTELAKAAAKVGFCWPDLKQTFEQMLGEVEELRENLFDPKRDWAKIADELGDVVYTVCCVSEHLRRMSDGEDLNLDLLARQGFEKFVVRFTEMEKMMQERGTPLTPETAKNISLEAWNKLWDEAKIRRYR